MTMARWLLLGLMMLCAGCQPPPPYVIATIESGQLLFHVRMRGFLSDRIFGWDDDQVVVRQLSILSGDRIIWRYLKVPRRRSCAASETFPVRAGEKRCGYRASGNAAALLTGQIYDVRLDGAYCRDTTCGSEWWSGDVVGRFRVQSGARVVNIRPD